MTKTPKPSRSKAKDADKPPCVQVGIFSMVALIDPAVPLLAPHLSYRRKRFEQGGRTGYQGYGEEVLLWNIDVHKRMAVPVGLLPRVLRVLAEHGYEVTVTDHRKFKENFQLDTKFAKSLGPEGRPLVEAVRQNTLGQIEVKQFADMIEKMRLIVNLYPKAHVLIPVATRKTAWKVQDELFKEDAGWGVHLLGGKEGWPQEPYRCMVCTFSRLQTCHTEDWEIVLLPDPLGATGDQNSGAMASLHGDFDKKIHRVYSFVRPGLRLGRRDRIRLELLSGQVIHRLGPEKAGIRVLWLPTPACSAIDKDATALEFKRRAYWHNDRRNDYVAAVARSFDSMDADKLREYGVSFRGGQAVLRNAPESVIVVLVASTEQGRELAKRLPGWKLVSAVAGSDSKEVESARSIVTETRASKSTIDADLIIRAGGSAGTGCFKGLIPLADAETKRDVILVDFEDEFDRRAVRDRAWRCREYELLGWDDEEPGGKPRGKKG